MSAPWPDIPYETWRETCSALHLYAQIVGKYRLARTPWVNHSWHATLYVDARGLTTSLVPDAEGIEIVLNLREHVLSGRAADGRTAGFPLGPMSVAEFHFRFLETVAWLGGAAELDGRPNELPDPIPFRDDRLTRPYDADAVEQFFHALIAISRVLFRFRTGYIGKVSPVHLFWGSFDLAVTRFSGRPAPLHPGGIPFLPDDVTREAYSHEVSSAGFWPGDAQTKFPAFYSYAYPTPKGFAELSRRQRERISIRSSASSCCRTKSCERRATQRRRSWLSSRAPIAPRPTWGNGIAAPSNARPANLSDPARWGANPSLRVPHRLRPVPRMKQPGPVSCPRTRASRTPRRYQDLSFSPDPQRDPDLPVKSVHPAPPRRVPLDTCFRGYDKSGFARSL